jgi:hypothetical protein
MPAGLGDHPVMPTTSPATRGRRLVRRTLLVFAATVAVAGGAFAVAATDAHDHGFGSPDETVRNFLLATAVDGNSVQGCTYLTPRAVRAFRTLEPPHTTCDEALTRVRLVLGGESIDDEAAVKGLSYHVVQGPGRARVSVSAHGSSLSFGLRRATPEDEVAVPDPDRASWRIDSGLDALLS